MLKTTVSKILDKALTDSFNHRMEQSPAPIAPVNVKYCDLQAKFMDTLSAEQQAAYQELDSMCSEVEIEENEHYYRLGFTDGLAAWRGI